MVRFILGGFDANCGKDERPGPHVQERRRNFWQNMGLATRAFASREKIITRQKWQEIGTTFLPGIREVIRSYVMSWEIDSQFAFLYPDTYEVINVVVGANQFCDILFRSGDECTGIDKEVKIDL